MLFRTILRSFACISIRKEQMMTECILEDEELGRLLVRVNIRARRLTFRTREDAVYVTVPPGTTVAEVKNAVEHAESEVKIGFYRYEMYAEITVQNDGEAISDEDKKHIFTRFYSGSGQPADSIGIGLSLA